mgnify:CR=1 FL=1
MAYYLLTIQFQKHIDRVRDAESPAGFGKCYKALRMFGRPWVSRTTLRKRKKSKGSVMTVQVHPVETEDDLRPEKQKPATERKKSDPNLINLWDERTDVGVDIVRMRDRRNDEKAAK